MTESGDLGFKEKDTLAGEWGGQEGAKREAQVSLSCSAE